MGGIVGRLFREFAVTRDASTIAVSAVVSLTLTPMMCSRFLQRTSGASARAALPAARARLRRACSAATRAALDVGAAPPVHHAAASSSPRWRLTVLLFIVIPKGFFPQQDTGLHRRRRRVRRRTSSFDGDERPHDRARRRSSREDPDVDAAGAFVGGSQPLNTGTFFIALQAAGRRPHSHRRPDHRAAAPKLRRGAGRAPVPAGRAGHARRRPRLAHPVPVHAAGRRTSTSSTTGRRKLLARFEQLPRAHRRGHRPAERRPHRPMLTIDRDRASTLRHLAGRRSTPRSTTPSASARWRSTSRSSTATTWCWR